MRQIYRYNDMAKLTEEILTDSNIENVGSVGLHINSYDQSKTIFHEGHNYLIRNAKQNCDKLILGIYPIYRNRIEKVNDKIIKSKIKEMIEYKYIDYIVYVDVLPNIIQRSNIIVKSNKWKNSQFPIFDLKERVELALRTYLYFGDLLDAKKMKIFNGMPAAFRSLINSKLSAELRRTKINPNYDTSPTIIYSAPIYKDKNGLLPERCYYKNRIRFSRLRIKEYIEKLKISIGDATVDIEDDCTLKCNLKNPLKIRFFDFNTMKESDLITSKFGILQAELADLDSINYISTLTEIKFMGINENKWHMFYDGQIKEI